ncbi:Enoyl-acyl-carrier-protein reductase NADH FabI [Porphyridium purpureum]|uniref:Enoyl-acyl-carrier-protein reductase NADH FabI n=1 Tax=Porphyridium purpureum TaxID=35688 RepID=A0A5J4YMM3_PORPP|nr:Enoyl-acyl-carrier-protein reductase NADH FabI [Porphyridium purpureum]|eukprot:POR4066..scf295_9
MAFVTFGLQQTLSVRRAACARTCAVQGAGRPGARRSAVSTTATRTLRMSEQPLIDLRGKKALITGIANNKSIAWGIAQSLKQAGAEIGITFLPMNEKVESKVRALTEPLEPTLFIELDVQKPEQIQGMANAIETQWGGQVDVFVHCLAFANRDDLLGSFSKTSLEGWNTALSISAHSLCTTTAALKPYMKPGSSVLTLSYLGATKVIPNYNVMGVAKAALESSTRYLAHEYGPDGIRVNAISAGPLRTLASSAIGGISGMMKHVEATAPLRQAITTKQVGDAAAFLLSEAASGITGQVLFVDSGYEIMGAPPGVKE